jgi:hypothetical protein
MRRSSGPPALVVFISTVALVLGVYYLWLGAQTYISTGGLGVEASTEQAVVRATSTAVQEATDAIPTWTPIPTFTSVPPCEQWVVTVPSAIVRRLPDTNSAILDAFDGGTEVCVIQRVTDTLWYLVDTRPDTKRIDEGYMRGDIIRPLNPTETPTLSATPLPTVTPITPSPTTTPSVTPTVDPNASPLPTATPMPSLTPTPTPTETLIPLSSA